MKIKKMAGALALTAALAMGSVPAFATASVSKDAADNEFGEEGGSTTIKASVEKYDENIRATVPLTVTIAFGSDAGGNDFIVPDASAYKITNVGKGDIVLTDAVLTMEEGSPFTSTAFGIDPANANNKYKVFDDANREYVELSDGNHMCFTFSAGDVNTYLTEGHKASDAKANAADKDVLQTATVWQNILIPHGEEGDAARELGIQLGGAGWFKTAIDKDAVTDTDLCKITYTIAAAPAAGE